MIPVSGCLFHRPGIHIRISLEAFPPKTDGLNDGHPDAPAAAVMAVHIPVSPPRLHEIYMMIDAA